MTRYSGRLGYEKRRAARASGPPIRSAAQFVTHAGTTRIERSEFIRLHALKGNKESRHESGTTTLSPMHIFQVQSHNSSSGDGLLGFNNRSTITRLRAAG